MRDDRERLLPLLDHLANTAPRGPTGWQEWWIEPIAGGRNNLVYHVTGEPGNFAVKFTIRDDRDRAGREYRALRTLTEARLSIAPEAVLLDQVRYRHPVVVQTWLEGKRLELPPTQESDWHALIGHYAALHTITPSRTGTAFASAVLTMSSVAAGRQRIAEQLALIPPREQPDSLRRLVTEVEQATFTEWPPPPVSLCRCDPTPQNFIRFSTSLASVDWENGGWGDPAFELADLMSHPSYLSLPASRLNAVVAAYDVSESDRTFATRVQTYYRLMLVWWAARLARMLYEVTRGLDRRLVPPPSTWQAEAECNFETYLMRARAALDCEAIQE